MKRACVVTTTAAVALAVAIMFAATAGCSAPDYGNGHLQCAPGEVCPSGFYCAADARCWRTGSGPDGDLGTNGTASDFAGDLLDLTTSAGGPSKCGGNSGVLFCEGFETSLLLGGWSQTGQNGKPTLDTSRAFRGSSSLHSHVDASAASVSPHASISETRTFPVSGTLYARVWVYFPSPLPVPFEQFLNLTDASSGGTAVATDDGAVTLDNYSGAVYQRSATRMPLDRWACVQLDFAQAGPGTGAIHIHVDGALLTDLPQSGIVTSAAKLILGLDFFNNSAPVPIYDAWFDELIVDDKPTSCDE
jgi:hypothetical protein